MTDSKSTKETKRSDIKFDVNNSNDELLFYLSDVLDILPDSRSFRVVYKYVTDVMKYLVKVDHWIILK